MCKTGGRTPKHRVGDTQKAPVQGLVPLVAGVVGSSIWDGEQECRMIFGRIEGRVGAEAQPKMITRI